MLRIATSSDVSGSGQLLSLGGDFAGEHIILLLLARG